MQGGPDSRNIPGNTIAVQSNMPFTGLTKFGAAFLSKFECSEMPHPVRIHNPSATDLLIFNVRRDSRVIRGTACLFEVSTCIS